MPPGWRPGDSNYPLKKYLEKLELWNHITDVEPEKIAPLAAGRLQGRVHTLALGLTITKQDGSVLRGLPALAFTGERAAAGPNGQALAATPSGLQALTALLQRKYGATDQDQQSIDLDDFLDLRRGRHTLQDYLIEFEHRYDKAGSSSGLVINDVGRSHMLLKYCQIDGRTAQIMLLVNHNLARYDDIFGHLSRIAKSDSVPGVSSNTTFAGDVGPSDEASYPEQPYEDDEYDWDDEEDWWPEDYEEEDWWDESASVAEPTQAEEAHDGQTVAGEDPSWTEPDDAFKGKTRKGTRKGKRGSSKGRKGKGRGKGGKATGKSGSGCPRCGSPKPQHPHLPFASHQRQGQGHKTP